MIAIEMLAAGRAGVSELRPRVSNVRYAPLSKGPESILFDLDGAPYRGRLKGRNADLVLMGGEADRAIAVRVLLDGDAAEKPP